MPLDCARKALLAPREGRSDLIRIGVTGHQELPRSSIDYITLGIREVLTAYDETIGLSSLAAGADQLFAEELLAVGGRLHAIIPAYGYSATLDKRDAANYERLLAAAVRVTRLPFLVPTDAAYQAAGRWIAEHSDLLIAVWDGQPARGLGGTADAVAHAHRLNRDVRVIWPTGTTRD